MSRSSTAVMVLALGACSGDDGGGGGGEWTQVPGLELQLVASLQVTPTGDVTMTRGLSHFLLRWDGSALTPIMPSVPSAPPSGAFQAFAGPDRSAHVASFAGDQPDVRHVQRIEGATTVRVAVPTPAEWFGIDSGGGLLAANNGAVVHFPPGATTSSAVPQATAGLIPEALGLAYKTDGAAYTYGRIHPTTMKGVVRIEPGGAGISMPIDCLRQELSFCNAEGQFFLGGAPTDAVHMLVAAGQRATTYRIEGSTLTPVAELPDDDVYYVAGVAQAPGGALYLVAAFDNLIGSDYNIYRLDGSSWRKITTMPGHGTIVVDQNGVIYGGLTPLSGPGGFWIYR